MEADNIATREEHIKKINAQLELMSDEELEQVAGGTAEQCADDSSFLNRLNGSCNSYTAIQIIMSRGALNKEIEKAWSTVGITAEVSSSFGSSAQENRYYINGKKITQKEAHEHAIKVFGSKQKIPVGNGKKTRLGSKKSPSAVCRRVFR